MKNREQGLDFDAIPKPVNLTTFVRFFISHQISVCILIMSTQPTQPHSYTPDHCGHSHTHVLYNIINKLPALYIHVQSIPFSPIEPAECQDLTGTCHGNHIQIPQERQHK